MSSQRATLLTPEEYLEIERRAERKSEYYQGVMYAMAGASQQHVLIVTNLIIQLGNELADRPCQVYSADLRLRVSPTGLYTYPDVVVVCGEARFADDQQDTLLNPTIVIEVLSESTQDYDRGRKFEHYRTLPSLRDYLTIAQDRPHIEHWSRLERGGSLMEYTELNQTVELPSIDAGLPLSRIYAKVEFDR